MPSRRLYLAHQLEDGMDTRLFQGRIKLEEMDLVLSMTVSWIFAIIKAIYAVIALTMGYHFFDAYISNDNFSVLSSLTDNFSPQKILLLAILLEVVFFPLTIWVFAKIWKVLIKFFALLFRVEGDIDSIADEIINTTLASHIFFLIPVIGRVAQIVASLVYIFAGLKNNLRMSNLQAVTVLISPILVLLVFIFFVVVSFFMLINII